MIAAAYDKEKRWKKPENHNRTAQEGGMVAIIAQQQQLAFDTVSLPWDAIKQRSFAPFANLECTAFPTTYDNSYSILVAIYNEEVIGLAKACWCHQHQGKLAMMSVLPTFRSRGLGDALVSFAEAVLLKASRQASLNVQIEVLSMYPRLVLFYERQGYVRHGDVIPFVRPDIVREDIELPTMTVLRKVLGLTS